MTKSKQLIAIGGNLMITLPWIIICLGFVLRLRQFLFNRSLSYDESLLALSIIENSLTELLKPLDYFLAAPIGFLVLEKLMVHTFGNNEYALRLFPFFAGLISLMLFYEVAKRSVGPLALVIGLGLFALADPLIDYSTTLKPYSSDVAIGLLLCLLGLSYLKRETLTSWNVFFLLVIGPIAALFSYPSVFILAGVGVSVIAADLRDRKWRKISQVSAVCSLWLLGFAIFYFISLRSLANNEFFLRGWGLLDAFMPLVPLSLAELRWFASAFFEIFRDPVGLSLAGLSALAFVTGCRGFLKHNKRALLILIAPIVFTLVASGLQVYPFNGRLLLFIVPSILLIIANGIEVIIEKTWHEARIIGIATTVLLFFHPLFYASQHLVNPRTVEEVRPIIRYIKERKLDEDILYLYYGAQPIFKYYQGQFSLADRHYIVGVKSRGDLRNYIEDLEKLRGQKRVWLLFSHTHSRRGIDEKSFLLYHLDNMGKMIDRFERPGAVVYLYDLTERTGRETPADFGGLRSEPFRQSTFRE